jgi:hypothetical protein
MSLNYSYKHDISYANYNNSNLPWKINSSYIYHNNQTINSSLNLGPINNNLVIESSQNNIVLVTPRNNKQVVVNNNMTINNNLDISNILKTNFINANDLCLNGILRTGLLTIIGRIDLRGTFTYQGGVTDVSASATRFRGVTFDKSMFYDVSIVNTSVLTSDFSNMNIFNSYIYNTPIGYDKSNNSNPAKAVFSDVLLYSLLLDTSTNAKCYIKFSNSNYNTPIIIKSSDDYAKLEISKPLNIGPSQINTNISNISVFNGDISCEKLYYSQLFPDVKLNNYFDISIGQVSVSGNSIPSINNRFNIGSNSLKFNEITSANFFGFLDGSCSLANDLRKNLDMSFNNLDIGGTITLNKQNLAQFLSGDLKTITSSIIDFSNVNRSLQDLSISLYSKADFDLCLNTNITKRSLLESSFSQLSNDITSISNSVYSKSDFDLCLNRNLLRTNDLSAIVSVLTDPLRIYSNLGYLNSSLVKVNSAKVSDELVFPYAITYIDDNVEDTNIRERYSYTMTTNKATTTVTSAYTITYTRVWTSTPINTTVDIQPDNASHLYVMMQAIRQTGVSWRRKWYDVDSNTSAQAVYRKITRAHTKTEQGPVTTRYEVDGYRTWQQHRDQNTSTRTLAVISSSDEKGKVIHAIHAYNSNVPYFIGATIINSYSTGGTITVDGDYIIHTFDQVGTHTLTLTHNINAEYLIVGGGGSGGTGRGGGGGAGGVRTGTAQLNAGSYNITVGAGGARAFANLSGNKGGNSSIGTTVALAEGGGGGGGWIKAAGGNGGSGGGAGVGADFGIFGSAPGGLGNANAIQGYNGSNTYDSRTGGGGGGAGGAGSGSTGGIGISSSITGTTKYYAGGGGAGSDSSTAGIAYGGQYNVRNGTYGGGNGVPYNSSNANTYFWTYNAWTDDVSTGLDSNATYTVAVNLGDTNAATVRGVYFQANAMVGTNYSIGGEVAYYPGSPTGNISGTGLVLAYNFIYGNNRTVTLSKLTPGATYKTSFFSLGFDSDLQIRNQTFAGSGIGAELNPNVYGLHRGIIINLTFIADNTGTVEFTINPNNGDNTFHLYALANRLVSTSSSPFASYTDAVANTGGGGGGTDPGYGLPSGAGGSGIVVIRYAYSLASRRANWKWYNNTTWNTSITDWRPGRPLLGTHAVIFADGRLYDYSVTEIATKSELAVFTNTNYRETIVTNVPADDVLYADHTFRTWEQHRTNAINLSNQNSNITYKLVSIHSYSANTTIANFAEQAGFDNIFIGGKRRTGSIANGRSSNDWAWDDASNWDYEEFFRGYPVTTYNSTFTGGTTPVGSSTTTNRPQDANTNTPPAAFHTLTDISQTNVKLPLLVSSSNGSIIATATAIKVLDLPANPSNTTSVNRNVSGFTDIAGGSNTQTLQEFTNYASNSNTNVTDYKIQKRTLKYEYDTFSYVNSYNANNGLTTGSFKISENSNNNSNYVSPFSVNSIPTNYSCIAITNDGMFVALGKASNVTVYMRTSSTWITLGSPISINFSAYTNTNVGIIPTQFTENWRKNLQNLAINFNYATGSATSQLILAFGDTINVIKVYSYSGVNWSLSNGFYSVAGGSWGSNPLTSYSASVLGVSTNTNFGYFVTLSQSPSVLGFSVDDKFYTYNCTTTNNTIRGSRQTLQASHNNYKNIIAFKMSSDAEKIIVSNTYYVFIYNWSATNWTSIRTINYVSSAITFTYPNTSTTRIPGGPRSLDISNISANECVFAIGFPDVLIDISVNRKARGYVEYWKLTDSSLNRLATLMPRKRDFNNSSVDSDEYFFSAGGIKITNANTIIVAPNFKFHFNGTTKKYELDPRNDFWTTHNSRATPSRFLASIQNEVENELVKISARNKNVWIGGKRLTNPTNSEGAGGKTSRNWEWITPDPWNYQNFASGQPNALLDSGLEFLGNGWNDLGMSNNRQAIFFNTTTNYSSKNTFTIFNNFFFHSSGFSSTYFPTDISTTVMARWYSRDTSLNPTNTNTIHFTAGGRIVSLTRKILTLSDIRLKENIVDSTPKLEDLLKVRVVNYSLKGSNGVKLIGVVAQELEELFPSLVNDGILSIQDINLGKTESYKSVKYSCFDVILIKAFQEQMAIINKLSLQLDELECKTNLLKTITQDYVILTQDLDLLKSENELIKLTINEIAKLIS